MKRKGGDAVLTKKEPVGFFKMEDKVYEYFGNMFLETKKGF
jgi:hypothetical protein